MNESEARYLAARNRHYYARPLHGVWVVWDKQYDDEVVFDHVDYIEARKAGQARTANRKPPDSAPPDCPTGKPPENSLVGSGS